VTPAQKRVLAAIHDAQHTRSDDARRLFERQAMADWAKPRGLVLAPTQRACLCRLVGVPCQRNSHECITLPGQDHTTTWNRDGNPAVFVSQPYGMDRRDPDHPGSTCRSSAAALCAIFGLRLTMFEEKDPGNPAWHYPGHVDFVEIERDPMAFVPASKVEARRWARFRTAVWRFPVTRWEVIAPLGTGHPNSIYRLMLRDGAHGAWGRGQVWWFEGGIGLMPQSVWDKYAGKYDWHARERLPPEQPWENLTDMEALRTVDTIPGRPALAEAVRILRARLDMEPKR
jgi:hypothetical protein